jgi:hypothetical protein
MKKTSKIISTLSALSMLASMCVIPAAHAEDGYVFDRSGANFVAGTDFENITSDAGQAYGHMQNTPNMVMSQTVTHSGKWSLHCTANCGPDVHTYLQNANWTWAYWNTNTEHTTPNSEGNFNYYLTKGKTYKYSYWVYADEGASVTTPDVLVKKSNGGYEPYLIVNNSDLPKQQWNYFEGIFTAETTELPFFWNMPANLYIDDIKLEEVVAPQMTATTLPADGKTDSVGRKNYTVTFDKDIASATVKVGTSTVTNTISEDKKTVSFEVLFEGADAKTVTVDVTDTDGATVQVARTFTIRDTWVAFADFDRYSTDGSFAGAAKWGFLNNFSDNNAELVEFSTTQAHTGQYSLHTKTEATGTIKFAKCWDYWNGSNNAIQVGHTYKYSYWVYADEGATVTTPNVLVKKSNGGYDPWLINNSDYSSLPMQQWNYFEGIFTSESEELPFFWDIPANLYIDDILLEEIPTANVVSTTIPEVGTDVALGYNEYTMTFDKVIKSANVTYNGKTTGADVSADGKTISFGIAAVKDGNVSIAITDEDGVTSTVTRAITVPDTLMAYADFDAQGCNSGYYFFNLWHASVSNGDGNYNSPSGSCLLNATQDLKFQTGHYSAVKFYDGCPRGTDNSYAPVVETGKWYKMSFYAKRADNRQSPTIGVAQANTSKRLFTITSDTMTKYEVTFKATMTDFPRLYRESDDGNIYIDEILIEEVGVPRDYIFEMSTDEIKAGASITASITNENLSAGLSATVIVALYKDGKMIDVEKTDAARLSINESAVTLPVTVPENISDGVYTAKAFLWENATTTMKPICKALAISEPAAAE